MKWNCANVGSLLHAAPRDKRRSLFKYTMHIFTTTIDVIICWDMGYCTHYVHLSLMDVTQGLLPLLLSSSQCMKGKKNEVEQKTIRKCQKTVRCFCYKYIFSLPPLFPLFLLVFTSFSCTYYSDTPKDFISLAIRTFLSFNHRLPPTFIPTITSYSLLLRKWEQLQMLFV